MGVCRRERPSPKLGIFLLLLNPAFATSIPDGSNDGRFLLKSDVLPEDTRFLPAVGNGHVATQVYEDVIYMNNVFNGAGNDSHRAMIPSPVAMIPELASNGFTLNMYTGTFEASFDDGDVKVEQRIYAHRSRTRLLVNEFTVQLMDGSPAEEDIDLPLNFTWSNRSPDMNLTDEEEDDHTFTYGETLEPEFDFTDAIPVFMYWTNVPEILTLGENATSQTWRFIASLSIDQSDAESAFLDAVDNEDALYEEHIQAWEALWEEGHVMVEDNDTLAQTINACFFHIMISTPDHADPVNPFAGLSPGGLARGGKTAGLNVSGAYNDYAGHVFWDMDTWIMPPIMQLHHSKAPIMISSRTRVLDSARQHAQDTGYKGARFPWEQAYSGFETCPWDPASDYQFHVTGDVAYSVRQYLYATKNMTFAESDVIKDLVMEIGRFWQSKTNCDDEEKGCQIHGVMGPDEYHFNVNNSVFTNYNAKLALTTPQYLMDLGVQFSDDQETEITAFNDIAEKMFILFNDEEQFHPQFEGFDHHNSTIKQSDVVLLGYPLMMDMTSEVRRNDLEIYEGLTDKFGPDTGTWSMHTVGWLELDDQDKANEMFFTMTRNINGPFKIFSEKPPGSEDGQRAVNFITGMGGLLQAVLFGYGGIRQRERHMDVNPYVLPDATSWQINGLDYRGFSLNLNITNGDVTVTLVKDDDVTNSEGLVMDHEDSGERYELQKGTPVTVSRGPLKFMTTSELPPPTATPSSPSPSAGTHLTVQVMVIAITMVLHTLHSWF